MQTCLTFSGENLKNSVSQFYHEAVLRDVAINYLVTIEDGIYLDCTLGGGGHAESILERIVEKGKLICLDADPDAIRYAEQRLSKYPNKILKQVFYDQLDVVLVEEDSLPVQGVLFDLGISSFQVNQGEKGFSYQMEGPLDMRFDHRQRLSGKQVVNDYPVEKLTNIFRVYGEEKYSKKIAREIVRNREISPIETTSQLADIVKSVIYPKFQNKSLSRIFQSIRIEVNDELNRLKRALEKAFQCLEKNGRIITIAYHSLEDKVVKNFFKEKELDCVCPPDFPQCTCDETQEMHIITRKAVTPDANEIEKNPRARSAKLRAATKIIPFRSFV